MKSSFITLVLLTACTLTFAQTDTLSLEQAIALALKNNGAAKIAELGVRQSESHVREAKSARLPQIYFRSHYLLAPEIGYNEIVTNGGEYATQLAVTMPLYDGGVRNALVEQSEGNSNRSIAALNKSRSDIAYDVRLGYYDVLRSQEELRIRRETVERLRQYASLLAQLQAGGGASESDLLKAQVDLNEAVAADDAAQQSVQRAKLSLNNSLGLPIRQELDVRPLPSEETFHSGEFPQESNLDIQLLEQDRKSTEYDLTIAHGERLPTIAISGDIGALGVTPNEFHNDLGYSVFVSLELPLFTWGGIDNRIEQKELLLQQADEQLQLQRRELETEWKSAISDFETARKILIRYSENISTAENNFLAAKSRFAGGSGSNLDVLDAQRTLVNAKLSYENTLFQLRADVAILLKLSGKE